VFGDSWANARRCQTVRVLARLRHGLTTKERDDSPNPRGWPPPASDPPPHARLRRGKHRGGLPMTDSPADAPAVRTRRLEVVDDEGRVRAVLGPLDSPDPTAAPFGLALLDPIGRPRVWLSLDVTGPSQVFDLAGNNVVSLGVNDPTADALHVGGYLHMTDLDGTPAFGWQVDEDGAVLARLGGRTR